MSLKLVCIGACAMAVAIPAALSALPFALQGSQAPPGAVTIELDRWDGGDLFYLTTRRMRLESIPIPIIPTRPKRRRPVRVAITPQIAWEFSSSGSALHAIWTTVTRAILRIGNSMKFEPSERSMISASAAIAPRTRGLLPVQIVTDR